jgi:competence protein ComEA
MHTGFDHPQPVALGRAAGRRLPSLGRVRGESGRVAARVRELLESYHEPNDILLSARPEPPPREPASDNSSTTAALRDRIAAKVPMRLGPSRAPIIAGVVLLAGVIVIAAWIRAGHGGDAVTDAPALPTASGTAPLLDAAPRSSAPASPTTTPSVLVVDVAGKVRSPGVYRLVAGSRVDDALRAAGGPLPGVNLNALNLAALLTDGQQIAVGVRGAAGVPAAGGSAPGTGGPINLNTATLEQLETLPGVGPVLGQRILDWRGQHGQFGSVDQLDDVAGVGPARLSELKPLVTV